MKIVHYFYNYFVLTWRCIAYEDKNSYSGKFLTCQYWTSSKSWTLMCIKNSRWTLHTIWLATDFQSMEDMCILQGSISKYLLEYERELWEFEWKKWWNWIKSNIKVIQSSLQHLTKFRQFICQNFLLSVFYQWNQKIFLMCWKLSITFTITWCTCVLTWDMGSCRDADTFKAS